MSLWMSPEPVEYFPTSTESEDDALQVVIRAVYRQVLGNAHVMDSQRLSSAESMLRNGDITVRDFVRMVAHSDLYRSLFFEASSPYRFIELNFKHLLGRAPEDQAEVAEHVAIYNEQGYEAEINSYIDSDEYSLVFGDNTVPYAKGTSTSVGSKNVTFNRAFALMRGNSVNDTGKAAKLVSDIAGNLPTAIKFPTQGSGAVANTGKRFSIKTVAKLAAAAISHVSQQEIVVSYDRLSATIQRLHKSGSKIVSITEVA